MRDDELRVKNMKVVLKFCIREVCENLVWWYRVYLTFVTFLYQNTNNRVKAVTLRFFSLSRCYLYPMVNGVVRGSFIFETPRHVPRICWWHYKCLLLLVFFAFGGPNMVLSRSESKLLTEEPTKCLASKVKIYMACK